MSTRRGPRQSMVEAADATAEVEAEIAGVTAEAAAVVVVAGAAGKNLQLKRSRVMFFVTARGTLPSAGALLPVGISGTIRVWAAGLCASQAECSIEGTRPTHVN